MFARGHCLLVGVPGLAKTLMIRTLADAVSLRFSRIQFTPDLMPADITGTEVIQEDKSTGQRDYRFLPGPVFANVILADEINRTPPKTQAALLEAMQERQVTVGGEKHVLPEPFFVLATQNPIEQEGTYPLPEAQLDRFMLHVWVDYPTEDEELEIVKRTTTDRHVELTPMLSAEQILELTRIVRKVPVADHVARYALRLARLTRNSEPQAPDFIREYVMWGAGPRASQYMVLGAKARAVLEGRYFVSHEDIQALAPSVLRHRIKVNFNADAEGISADDIIQRLIDTVPTVAEQEDAVEKSPKSLDPRTLAKLKGLHLRAQHIVEGYVAGLHRSPYHGFSIEFAEHREYAPGDDLRYVDWKVFGRTDKFYLKQYDDETNLICQIVLDVSESMSYRGPNSPLSKFEYAQSLAAALAWLVLQQQDAIGLVTFDNQIRASVRASSNPSHLQQVLQVLESARLEAETSAGPIFHELAETDEEAKRGRDPERLVRRSRLGHGWTQALSPSSPRCDRFPRARSRGTRFLVFASHNLPRPGTDAQSNGRPQVFAPRIREGNGCLLAFAADRVPAFWHGLPATEDRSAVGYRPVQLSCRAHESRAWMME